MIKRRPSYTGSNLRASPKTRPAIGGGGEIAPTLSTIKRGLLAKSCRTAAQREEERFGGVVPLEREKGYPCLSRKETVAILKGRGEFHHQVPVKRRTDLNSTKKKIFTLH